MRSPMRLINIHTLGLKDFVANPPPYAILSHRWTDSEVSYKEFLKQLNDQSTGYTKIRQFCEYVQKTSGSNGGTYSHQACDSAIDGSLTASPTIDWAWVDACCIDKRSSAELSEAINSMWKWYQNAVFCVAYLADVPALKNGRDIVLHHLSQSDWFNRGWTLQELLAPKDLIFLTSEWEEVGTKRDKDVLQILINRTGIEEQYLAFAASISYASVAQKFSWCSQRVTTRDEDIAYCLLGLLNVNMPLLYGEGGHKAFQRLQFELIGSSSDDSIFAWNITGIFGDRESLSGESSLALHPRYFGNAGRIRQIRPHQRGYIPRSPFFVTNLGISFESPARRLKPTLKDPEALSAEHQTHLKHFLKVTRAYLVPLNCRDAALDNVDLTTADNDRLTVAIKVEEGVPSNARMVGKVVPSGFEDSEVLWQRSRITRKKRFQLYVDR